jgi:hypothetical protein
MHVIQLNGKAYICFTAAVLEECDFTSGLCNWLSNKAQQHQTWITASNTKPIAEKGLQKKIKQILP